MKAIVYDGPGSMRPVARPEPKPAAGELLLRPLTVGVCFTDKLAYDGFLPPGTMREGNVPGHEFCARVEAIGDGVDGWTAGERVSVDPRTYCGRCIACRAGLYSQCATSPWIGMTLDGAYADFCVAPATNCYRMPDALSDVAAAFVEPACFSTRSVRNAGITLADQILVLGADDYGTVAIEWARHAGAETVLAADTLPIRRAAAVRAGADRVFDPTQAGFVDGVRGVLPVGADTVFVSIEPFVAASQWYLRWAFDAVRVAGQVVVLRLAGNPFEHVNAHIPWEKEVALKYCGGNCFGEEPLRGGRARGDWQVTIGALHRKQLSVDPLEGIVLSFDDLRSKRDVDELFQSLPSERTKVFVRIST